jgi:hypothetical protein
MGHDTRPLAEITPDVGIEVSRKNSGSCRRTATYAFLVCMAGLAAAQPYGSPRDPRNGSQAAPQICVDGQASGEQKRLSLQRHPSGSDNAPLKSLETAPDSMQSQVVSEKAASSSSRGGSLQCLRVHPPNESAKEDKASETSGSVTPAAPQVTFTDGILTVDPHNAPLGEVLGAIRASVGFKLDVPISEMDGRVFDRIGPLPLRDALVQLLYGSGFNYIIQTAPDDPQAVKNVFVSPKTGNAIDTAAAPHQPSDEVAEDQALYGGFADPSLQEQPPPPAVAQQPPRANTGSVPGIPAGFNLKQAAEEAHKTPAEILSEMQKRQIEILDAQAPQQDAQTPQQ